MVNGYFLVHRSIWDSQQFKSEPFSQREAFMWMISEAAWKDTSIRYGDHRYTVLRGQFVSSIRRMADIWQWDKNKVDRFLNNLMNERCLKIGTNGAGKPRHITICNYDEYQEKRDNDGTTNGTTLGQPRDKDGTYKKETNQLTSKPVEDRDTNVSLVPSVPDENRSRKKYPDHFEMFWRTFPKRPTDTKTLAFKAWTKAMKSVDAPLLFDAAMKYSVFIERTGHESLLVQTWVNREGWTADYSNGQARASPQKANAPPRGKVEKWEAYYREKGMDLKNV